MEELAPFFQGRRVLVTGHTGFKGSWLALWLKCLDSCVSGVALDPPTEPNLFTSAGIDAVLEKDLRVDIENSRETEHALRECSPEIVFHLAAQPLVRSSYASPLETYRTNILGTANLLDACRRVNSVKAVVVVTSDKCYENDRREQPYREADALGGHDPYSASKACAEIVSAAAYKSFLRSRHVGVATARAGNVIGGGDWATDRLVPDSVRAFVRGEPLRLRNPRAIRPWQHVLEPLHGYLLLARQLMVDADKFSCAWNFGPDNEASATVETVAREIAELWPGGRVESAEAPDDWHEEKILRLDSSRAHDSLGWESRWPLSTSLKATVDWYRKWSAGDFDAAAFMRDQINDYLLAS